MVRASFHPCSRQAVSPQAVIYLAHEILGDLHAVIPCSLPAESSTVPQAVKGEGE